MSSLRRRGKVWYFAYVDGEGKRFELRGCPQKRVTEGMTAAAEAELPAFVQASAGSGPRALADQIDNLQAHVMTKSATVKRANNTAESFEDHVQEHGDQEPT